MASRSILVSLIFFMVAGGFLLAQLPDTAVPDSGQSVIGAYEGWYQNPDGTYTFLLGYFNRNGRETPEISVGPNNRIEPGGPDRGQPTTFLPRRQWGVFTVTVPRDFGDKKLTWTIVANGQTTSIPMTLNPLWVVEPLKDAGAGNTPPVIKFEPSGPGFQGPPRTIAKTFTTKLPEPLALPLWVTDDGKSPPERGRVVAGTRPTLSWSKFRGPGTVTFDNARPVVNAEGVASTNAKFAMPGEYILRVQANDSSGDGGGGFQCCWTNVHVRVTVTP